MTLYCCNETNVITEAPYEEISAGFCIVEKYEYVYQKELPRFRAMPGIKPYGLPQGDAPKKMYAGIGNPSYETAPQKYDFYRESCRRSESEVSPSAMRSFPRRTAMWFGSAYTARTRKPPRDIRPADLI